MKKEISSMPAKKDLELVKRNLEKTGAALGDLFKGIFKGVSKILDVAQEMEKKGERERSFRKEIKGFTKKGKEFRGEAGWRIKTGILQENLQRKKQKRLKG